MIVPVFSKKRLEVVKMMDDRARRFLWLID